MSFNYESCTTQSVFKEDKKGTQAFVVQLYNFIQCLIFLYLPVNFPETKTEN